MFRRPSILGANLIALALALTALFAAAFYATRAEYPFVGGWTDFIDVKIALLMFAAFNGIVAASIQAEKEPIAQVFALLCAPFGIGLAVRHWLQMEASFAGNGDVKRETFGAAQAHMTFVGPEYVQSLSYAVAGLAGSAAILAILHFRKRQRLA